MKNTVIGKAFIELWDGISSVGISAETDGRLARKVRLTNQIVTLACIMTFIQIFMFPDSLYPIVCALALIGYAVTFWFNSTGRYNTARIYFCLVSCLAILIGGSLVTEDTNISFRIMLIQAFVIPMVVFDTEEFRIQMLGFLAFIAAYLLFDPINEAIPMLEGVDIAQFDSNENILINGVFCMIILLLGNRYLQKLNYKAEISLQKTLDTSNRQKLEILRKNKFIHEGIAYAERIQKAVLPNREELNVYLPDHFVYFEPKEIICGDFYWYGEFKEHILIAAVDCTGHGAPGALISIIGSQILDKIVKEHGVTDPAEVLEILNLEIIKTLHQDKTVLKDGLDISLLSLNMENRTIRFAGAKNSLIIIRDGEVERIRGKGVSIGDSYSIADGFENHEIEVSSKDSLFLITDGVIDQFGGRFDKKFLHKNLYDAILSNHAYSMDIQADCLKRVINNWKGEKPQTDDILMIGLRIDFDHISQVNSFRRPESYSPIPSSMAS